MRTESTRRISSQAGETLLESLISLMLLSIVGAAAFTGLQVALRASAMHHQLAVAETLLRTTAEDLQNPDSNYIPLAGCPGQPNYAGAPARPGYQPMVIDVTPISALTMEPVGMPNMFGLGLLICPMGDTGLQRVELTVVTPSGHSQTLEVLKRRQ